MYCFLFIALSCVGHLVEGKTFIFKKCNGIYMFVQIVYFKVELTILYEITFCVESHYIYILISHQTMDDCLEKYLM